MKKILVIGYVWPEPASSAAGSHMMSILRLFKQQNWQVEFASPAQQTEYCVDLAAEGISAKSIALNCDSFDVYIADYKPDIVMFDRFMMEEQFAWRVEKNCPDALKILDTEDLQCLRHARQQALKAGREFTHDLTHDITTADLFNDIVKHDIVKHDIAKREIAAIIRCDISLIISSYEMQLLTDVFKVDASLLHYLPFMVNLNKCPQKTGEFSEREHFVSIGNFRHAPNWDMVLYLQKIWPLIRQKIPRAECHIYGAYTPPKATALNNPKSGFLIKGRAQNALTVMENCRVCLAPIRFGAGIKGKLLDAMIMQTPSVTTSLGSEGMYQPHQDVWPGEIADETLEFVKAAIKLYNDEASWLDAQQHASDLLNRRYDSGVLGKALIDKLLATGEALKHHRLNNFTGAMLKHHSMMSTQYMSQWIAEKNRNTPV